MADLPPMPFKKTREHKSYPVASLKEVINIIRQKCGVNFISERHGNGDNKVVILPEAMRELEVMISYGRRSPMNVKEQKYTGYGHFLMDENGLFIVIVSHFIEIQTMNRTAVSSSNLGPNGEYNPGIDFLEYHREEFLNAEMKYNTDAYGYLVDPFIELCGPSEFVLEGHTHPDLGVFYSGTDMESGIARAAAAPVCIFVCDPIRKEMLGSIGKEFAKAEVIVFTHNRVFMEKHSNEKRLLSPSDEIVTLTKQCLRIPGTTGYIRFRAINNGKRTLRIKLVIPGMKNIGDFINE